MSSSQDLISLFRSYVKLQPTAIATQDDSFTLTYSELERWSNNLAHEIHSRLKNTPGCNTVAVCVPRSVLFVVSVLAVVKAGFSYLPLDPSSPPTRLDDQIMRAGVRLVVSVSWHKLPSLDQAIPFDIVPFIDRTCVSSRTALPSFFSLRNDTLAIFFTSGSTGRPKGVLVQHIGMLNMINSLFMEIRPGDRVSMANNPVFDASSIDIWNTLCHGGTLLVLTAHLADNDSVISFLREKEVTKTFLPTAVFHNIVNNVSNVVSMGTTLRIVGVGGEKLTTASVQAFFRHAPTTRLLNIYGPTEASVFTTTFEIPSLNFSTEYDDAASRPIPIGHCIPNSAIYILDDNLLPVHIGLPGEICISGAGLAAGYLGQDDLTANKFVTVNNLEGTGSLTRIYRTGDIGRFIPSKNGPLLEYIGRNDNQIKIRGQRIELGEIEAILRTGSDGIDQAVVVFAEEKLIAYVVQADGNTTPDNATDKTVSDLTDKLLEHCSRNLPSYMVPYRIIVTRSLPLTGNGKIDRKMLIDMWTQSSGVLSETYLPENEIQARIQECVGKALGEEPMKIPLETDFIALGIHSFRAAGLLSALRTQFAISKLPFIALLQYPTVKALGSYLEEKISSSPGEVAALSKRPAHREVSYDHDQLRQVLEYRGLTMEDVEDVYETTFAQKFCLMGSSPHSYMMHQLATAHTDVDTLISAIVTVISRHTALRSTVFPNLQHQVVFRYHQKLRDDMIHVYPAEDAQSLESIVRDDKRYALTIPGNLIRFEIFRTEPPTLLILAQHAVMDAWSRDFLLQDLDRAISGKQLPKPVPFRNYVDYMIAEEYNPDKIAWHADRLRNAEVIGFPRCDKSQFSSSSYFGPNFLRVEEFPGMGEIAQAYNIKLSTLFKVAFALVIRNESKRDTIVMLQTESCRSLPVEGITEICAFTSNGSFDRIDFFQTDTVLELLRRTQQNQDKITDLSIASCFAILSDVKMDLALLATSSYTFSQKEASTYDVLQVGPAGAENNVGVEWATLVDGDRVKVRVDYDPIFSDRISAYVDQFFVAAHWLIANIQADSLDGLQL